MLFRFETMTFGWKIALMDAAGLPRGRGECDEFQRRSGILVRSPYRLSSAWMEDGVGDYTGPNLVAEAARDLGVEDDRVRLALARAGLVEGLKVGRIDVAARVGAAASGLDADLLAAHARTEGVMRRVKETTEEFRRLGATQRPAFIIENDIGDRAVFSGLHSAGPLLAAAEAMIEDSRAFGSWRARFGDVPGRA